MKIRLLIILFLAALLLGLSSISSAQSLGFSAIRVIDSQDGLLTVPSGKVWKIVNINGGSGQITVTGASTRHCGTSCSGGVCSSSSCKYEGFIWELNGVPMDQVDGCFVCSGSNCSNIANCPPTHTYNVGQLPQVNVPFWLEASNTIEVNASNVFFSIIEFNIVP